MPVTCPKISVVIGSYNCRKVLELCIEAVRTELRGQSYEIIVVDGGSTDGTVNWLTTQMDIIPVTQNSSEERLEGTNYHKPSVRSMNLGFKCATGKYVCLLSVDALIVPGSIVSGMDLFDEMHSRGTKLGGVAFYFRDFPVRKRYAVAINLGNLCVTYGLFLRSAVVEAGYYDEDYCTHFADADLSLKMRAVGYSIIDSPDSFVEACSEIRPENRTSTNDAGKQQDRQRLMAKWQGRMFAHDEEQNEKRLGRWHLHSRGPGVANRSAIRALIEAKDSSFCGMPFITVVTIVYNDAAGLARTIQSVGAQNYPFVEFIVVDGASGAATQKVITCHRHAMDRLVSEPDSGIYNAMNKGLRRASGDWTVFMNAGDTFHEPDTLSALAPHLIDAEDQDRADVVYGDSLYRYEQRETPPRLRPAQPIVTIRQGMPFCHQAVYYRTEVLKAFPFNETFRFAADYDQLTRLYKAGKRFRQVPLILCDFFAGGGSESGLHPYLECLKIQLDQFGDGDHLKDSRYMQGFLANFSVLLEKYR